MKYPVPFSCLEKSRPFLCREGGNRMAGRIQGITVEIGGDTTKLQTALKGVNTDSEPAA